ncbi:MAG: DUF5698 domain-containing protein [Prevotellaceae bacterium]|jgi:uncharacterized protein YebE (UPF0316 family)|nr:DUF5698 domain-containing protein [Prevotellaceae bacterium]
MSELLAPLLDSPLLPLLIFFARICDVTLGTMRIIFISKGKKTLAPFVAFFEVLIWIIVISELLSHTTNFFSYVCYAGGYATGSYVGMYVEERLAIGIQLLQVYTKRPPDGLMQQLNSENFGATIIDGQGANGQVFIVQIVVTRKNLSKAESIVNQFDPDVFYVLSDTKTVQRGIFPIIGSRRLRIQRVRPGK